MAEEQLLSRLQELARRALFRNETVYTRFLDLHEQSEAVQAAHICGVSIRFEGGYPEAERRVAAFYSFSGEEEEAWPFGLVRIHWRPQFGTPAHRDILGALMALGFERSCLGDIVMDEGCAWLFALKDMAPYITERLTSCGRVSVKSELFEGEPDMPPPKGRTVRVTVPSLRLDALVAAAYDLSRSEASKVISQGRVFVDQREETRGDVAVHIGALISLRGQGRFRLTETQGETRKGRLAVYLFVYG